MGTFWNRNVELFARTVLKLETKSQVKIDLERENRP